MNVCLPVYHLSFSSVSVTFPLPLEVEVVFQIPPIVNYPICERSLPPFQLVLARVTSHSHYFKPENYPDGEIEKPAPELRILELDSHFYCKTLISEYLFY